MRGTVSTFKDACSSLFADEKSVEAQLPTQFTAMTDGGNLLPRLWAQCMQEVNSELRGANDDKEYQKKLKEQDMEFQKKLKKQEMEFQKGLEREKMERERIAQENMSRIHGLVCILSKGLRSCVTPVEDEGAPLLNVHEVVHLDKPPEQPHRAAVWNEFQWVRALTEALKGGSDSFMRWLKSMVGGTGTFTRWHEKQRGEAGAEGHGGGAAHKPDGGHGKWTEKLRTQFWRRHMNEQYHTIHRPRSRPGEFIGGRLQAQSPSGIWEDIADDTPLRAGPRRVLVSYQAAGVAESTESEQSPKCFDEFAGLLVNLPAVHTSSADPEKDHIQTTPLTVKNAAGEQEYVTLHGKKVHYMRIVLTLPRLHMLEQIADVFQRQKQGMLLQGVHGAGKTSVLKALVSILSVGAEANVLYAPKSQNLALLDLDGLLRGAMYGSGQLAKQLLSGEYTPAVSCPDWRDAPDQVCWNMWLKLLKAPVTESGFSAKELVERGTAILSHMRCSPHGMQVVVFDEVNELLQKVKYHERLEQGGESDVLFWKSREFWKEWLPWKTYGGRRNFRVLASSPHGKREDVADVTGGVHFELRPAPADHLAAVLQCAPEYLGGDPLDQSPNPGSTSCPWSAAQCLDVCEALGGNARYVAAFLQQYPAEGAAGSHALGVTLPAVVSEHVDTLSKRFGQALLEESEKLKKREQALPAAAAAAGSAASGAGSAAGDAGHKCPTTEAEQSLFDLATHDASLVVRSSALTSLRPYILAGAPALLAILRAVRGNTALGLALLTGISVDNFEAAMAVAISMGAAAKRMWPLALLQKTDKAEAKRKEHSTSPPAARHGVFEWPAPSVDSSSTRAGLRAVLDSGGSSASFEGAKSNSSALLGGAIVLPVKLLFGNELSDKPKRVVFQTVPSFPGIDAVCIDQIGDTVQVTFWEITVSKLREHSKGRDPVAAKLKCGDDVRGQVQVDTALRDMLAIMGVKNKTCSQPEKDGSVRLAKNGTNTMACVDGVVEAMEDDTVAGTSTVNCLLATLGVPLVVRSQLVAAPPLKPAKGTRRSGRKGAGSSTWSGTVLCHMKLWVEQSDELCNQLHGDTGWQTPSVTSWSFRMVYATSTMLADNLNSQYGDVEADFVYGVFRDDLWF